MKREIKEHRQVRNMMYESRSEEYMLKICYIFNWEHKVLFTKVIILDCKDDTLSMPNSTLKPLTSILRDLPNKLSLTTLIIDKFIFLNACMLQFIHLK
mgnify:CR=1 FL=1